jgi:hypothetical protein
VLLFICSSMHLQPAVAVMMVADQLCPCCLLQTQGAKPVKYEGEREVEAMAKFLKKKAK